MAANTTAATSRPSRQALPFDRTSLYAQVAGALKQAGLLVYTTVAGEISEGRSTPTTMTTPEEIGIYLAALRAKGVASIQFGTHRTSQGDNEPIIRLVAADGAKIQINQRSEAMLFAGILGVPLDKVAYANFYLEDQPPVAAQHAVAASS